MKFFYSLLLLLLLAQNIITAGNSQKTSLSGTITDKATGQTIPGVTIYVPDLKTGAVTDINGHYLIENLPQTKVLVQITFIGYKTIVETIDLSQITTRDFALEISAKEI